MFKIFSISTTHKNSKYYIIMKSACFYNLTGFKSEFFLRRSLLKKIKKDVLFKLKKVNLFESEIRTQKNGFWVWDFMDLFRNPNPNTKHFFGGFWTSVFSTMSKTFSNPTPIGINNTKIHKIRTQTQKPFFGLRTSGFKTFLRIVIGIINGWSIIYGTKFKFFLPRYKMIVWFDFNTYKNLCLCFLKM